MLTVRQQELLDYLQDYHQSNGVMPSTRDIQKHFGFASQTAAVSHLRALERKGVIKKFAGKARAVIFPQALGRGAAASVPVFGSIAAGMPSDVEPEADGHLTLDASIFGMSRTRNSFALKVRGDSMIDAHICPGDYVVLERRDPRDGDIVAALIDGETTLKRFVNRDGKAWLKAENPAYPDLEPAASLSIQGVMVGLVRGGQ